jgi:anti-sigma-K factor RskA
MLTGAYAADALPVDEREEFEAHLRMCDACTEEVRELRATVAKLASAAARSAPPELRARVLAEVATVRQLPPLAPPERDTAPAKVWWRSPLAYAAALLLVVSVALGAALVAQQNKLDSARSTAAQIAEIATDPDRVSATSAAQGGGSGTVVAAHDDAVFVATGLAPLPADKRYQLWMIGPSGVRSGGVLDVDNGTTQRYVEGIGDAAAMAVSVEPKDGSKQPTTDPVWNVDLPA